MTGSLYIWLLYPLISSISPTESNADEDVILRARKIIVVFIFVICGFVILGALNIGFI